MKSRKRGRPPGSPNRPKDVGPTPETAANLIPDAINGLPGNEKYPGLPKELQMAAVAINDGFCLICAKSMCRASTYGPRAEGMGPEFDANQLLLVLRYQEWMRVATRRGYCTEALIDMIVEGHRPEWCDNHYRFPPGDSLSDLTLALKLYTQTRVQGLEAKLTETGDQFILSGAAA